MNSGVFQSVRIRSYGSHINPPHGGQNILYYEKEIQMSLTSDS